MQTIDLARRHGSGADLTDGESRFLISDYSPATGQVYGWKLRDDGRRGRYQKLPATGLELTK